MMYVYLCTLIVLILIIFLQQKKCVFGQNYVPDQIEAAYKAIEKSGREMIYSLSPGGQAAVYKSEYVSNMTNMYRVTGDTWDKVNYSHIIFFM